RAASRNASSRWCAAPNELAICSSMRLAIDTSGVEQAIVALDGRRLLAADDWSRRPDDPPVLARLEKLVERAGGRPDDLDMLAAGRVIDEPADKLLEWLPAAAGRAIPQGERRRLSAALADCAIWTFESQKPLRYDEVQALYVQPAAAEERRRKAP